MEARAAVATSVECSVAVVVAVGMAAAMEAREAATTEVVASAAEARVEGARVVEVKVDVVDVWRRR